jgi:hypothetical protein
MTGDPYRFSGILAGAFVIAVVIGSAQQPSGSRWAKSLIRGPTARRSIRNVTAHYDLGDKGSGLAGLALDIKNQVLFVACRNSGTPLRRPRAHDPGLVLYPRRRQVRFAQLFG